MRRVNNVNLLIGVSVTVLALVVGIISFLQYDSEPQSLSDDSSPDPGNTAVLPTGLSPAPSLLESQTETAPEVTEEYNPVEGVTVEVSADQQGSTFHINDVEWKIYEYVTQDGETVTIRLPPGYLPPPGIKGDRFPLAD